MFNATNKNNGFTPLEIRGVKKKYKKNKSLTGFTLVEMLVTMFIFSLIIGAATGVFVSAIRAQRYNLAYQQLLDQTSYTMEYMARAIRMAQKDNIGYIDGTNYLETASSIKFVTYHGKRWEFFWQSNKLKMNKDGVSYDLTSPNFEVTSLKFAVSGDEEDFLQPKVTVFMEIQGGGPVPQPKIKIQTTISQRNLDIDI